LENKDHIETGLTRRDLALACLVAFHHFNLEKALSSPSLQKRTIPLTNKDAEETIDIPVFPGLADEQFNAIIYFAKTEKWPLTPQGLFYELKRSGSGVDPSLLDAFYLTSEYDAIHTLLTKTGINLSHEELIDLIMDGTWKTLSELTARQGIAIDLTPERRRRLLMDYVANHSKIAAKLILDTDPEYVSKRLDDSQILSLLDLYSEQTPTLVKVAKALLVSPRTDSVHKRAAMILYQAVSEPIHEPYDHALALQRFFPQPVQKPVEQIQPLIVQVSAPIVAPAAVVKKIIHVIEPGDSLWKIARKYHVTVEQIMRLNRMESEKLRPGKKLEIPDSSKK
jgi:LysM repeat protein